MHFYETYWIYYILLYYAITSSHVLLCWSCNIKYNIMLKKKNHKGRFYIELLSEESCEFLA